MNPTELSFVQILEKYRNRDVQIVFKNGHTQRFYVEEIENQLDGWNDVLFMTIPFKKDGPGEVWMHDIKTITALN